MEMKGIGGEDEIELELGLSLGRKYDTRLQKLVSVEKGTDFLGFGVQGCTRSRGSSGFVGPSSEQEMNSKAKREFQALRRQEAKKKRGEKQLKRTLSKGELPSAECSSYSTNGGGVQEEPECKKTKTGISMEAANFSVEPAPASSTSPTIQPILTDPVPHPHALRFGQTGGGVVSPCWFAERNAILSSASYSFGAPFQVSVELGGKEHDSEQNGGEGGSYGSTICTSSDYRSSSREGPGGSSSDSRSHSMQSILQQTQLNSGSNSLKSPLNGESSNIKSQSEKTATSSSSDLIAIKAPPNDAQSDPLQRKEEDTKSDTYHGMNASTVQINPKTSSRSKKSDQQVGYKPPPMSLPYMPCVSTTGNGPNGRTVHGFLYKYTKAEVSIICVCHGTSFSPMEFVQHAGGIDVSHPLKHITVVPSAI